MAAFHRSTLMALYGSFSWQELRQHPWRNAAAIVAVMLGVALAFSVHAINASALDEFSQALRSVGGEPDLELRAGNGRLHGVDDALFARIARERDVAQASPVLELSTYALDDQAHRVPLRVVGVDALQIARLTPDLMPLPGQGADRLAVFAANTVFLNPAARSRLQGDTLQLQVGLQVQPVRVAGSVHAAGNPLAVMDIGAAQDFFGKIGQLTRVDIRLRAGVDRDDFVRRMQASPDWPMDAQLAPPGNAQQRMGALSSAYRVNLTVLALVALFTGAFLVFSVLSLSVTYSTTATS